MKVHADAALGPAGRLALVEAIESGMTLRAAAAALNVAPATAHRRRRRRRQATRSELRSGSCQKGDEPGSGPPGGNLVEVSLDDLEGASSPWPLPAAQRASTLRRAVTEWSRPGALIHVDTAQLAAFDRHGHRVLGRSTESLRGRRRAGYLYLHVAVEAVPVRRFD